MKQTLKGALLLFSLSAVLLAGCESREKREFNAGCQQGGLKRSICSCIYDRLEQHYSREVMRQMTNPEISQRMTPPHDFMDFAATATQQCAQSR